MYEKFRNALKDSTKEDSFKTNFGEIKNLKELRTLLFAKGKKLFNHYVDHNENHFANWIEHAFSDDELASSLRLTNSFHTTLKILDSRIKYLELWVEHNKDKEEMSQFLLKNKDYHINFEPEFHKFETLQNHNLNWVNEFFPEKNNEPTKTNETNDFEQKLGREVQMLKDLQTKYQFETKPSLFQRIFKKK